MQKRNVLNSPRLLELKRSRRNIFLRKIIFFVVIALIIFFGLAYFSHLNSLNIAEVNIIGNKVLGTEILKTEINQQLSGKYLWLFPKTNILIYPQNTLIHDLENKFSRIKKINMSIKNDKVLEVSLVEREAKYLWCGMIPIDTAGQNANDQKCFFMDENGYFFDEAPYFSDEVYFKFYGLPDEAGKVVDNPVGQYYWENYFDQLIVLRDAIVGMGLKPISLYAMDNKDAEIILAKGNGASAEPKIIFSLSSDFQNIAENLKAALGTEPLQTKMKNKYSSLQYIDLRFENKVYDKFQ